jgi:signal transduction histidine kinase
MASTVLPQTTVNRLVLAAVITGFLVLTAILLTGVVIMQRNLDWTHWVEHTYQVENAITDFRVVNERLETARRGYLLSGADNFRRAYEQSRADATKAVVRIQGLTQDSPAQQARLAALKDLQRRQLAAGEASLAQRPAAANGVDFGAFVEDPGVQATRAIRQLTSEMASDERRKLGERRAARVDTLDNLVAVVVLAGVVLVMVAGGSLFVIFRFTRDLTASHDELRELNEGLEEAVRARTYELRRANEEIQRFAYIVSHDLRSPLVNVMGFTSELEVAAKPLAALLERAEQEAPQIVTADARAAVTSDLPESLAFIRGSTEKMDRLISAILRLSREGRRVLTPETVELDKLFEGIAQSVAHRAHEVGATIEIAPGLPSLLSDRLALEQIFSNLMENALKYLAPGRPGLIRVRAARTAGRVVVEIADNGRGVDPKDHSRIFDLFRRSGAQDQPGEGIGLAHVRALGYRLGATVTVDSTLDAGATFRVSLPSILSPEAAAA